MRRHAQKPPSGGWRCSRSKRCLTPATHWLSLTFFGFTGLLHDHRGACAALWTRVKPHLQVVCFLDQMQFHTHIMPSQYARSSEYTFGKKTSRNNKWLNVAPWSGFFTLNTGTTMCASCATRHHLRRDRCRARKRRRGGGLSAIYYGFKVDHHLRKTRGSTHWRERKAAWSRYLHKPSLSQKPEVDGSALLAIFMLGCWGSSLVLRLLTTTATMN
jgi:hypothetical protein